MKIFIFLILLVGVRAHGQTPAWGNGQWGGMQACPYQTNPMAMGAPGASNVSDEVRQIQDDIKDAKSKLASKKSQKKTVDRDMEKAHKDIEDVIQGKYAEFVFAHIENSRECEEYRPEEGAATTSRGRPKAPAKTGPFSSDEWQDLCEGRGAVSGEVCVNYKGTSGKASTGNCQKALPVYRKKYAESQKLQDEVDSIDREVGSLNDKLKDARQDAIAAQKDGSDVCLECLARSNGYTVQPQQSTNWPGVIAGVGMGLAGMYAGYKTNQVTAQYNSNIGFATQPASSFGYGYPYFNAAMYGAMGGGVGQGNFGCGAGYGGTGNVNGMMGMGGPFGNNSMYGNMYGNNGGAFGGYPQNMQSPQMGGGMYNPGMGAWGMAGPWGNQNNMSGLISGGPNGMGAMGGMQPGMGYGNMSGSPYGAMSGMNGMIGGGAGGISGQFGIGGGVGFGGQLGANPQMQQYQMYLQQQQQQQQYSSLAYQQQMASLMARMQSGGVYGGMGTNYGGYNTNPLLGGMYGNGGYGGYGAGTGGIMSSTGSITGGALGGGNLLGSSMQNNFYYPPSTTNAITPLGTGR